MGVYLTASGRMRFLDNGDDTGTLQVGLRQAANRTAGTIASGTAVSGAISTIGYGPRGLSVQVPSAWTAAKKRTGM